MDPSQPTARAMAYVKHRNNICDLHLRRDLVALERERANAILTLDHDRLDLKDFLRAVKVRDTDNLPEAKIWLGDKNTSGKSRRRQVYTAPPGGTNSQAATAREVQTAPPNEQEQNADSRFTGAFSTSTRRERDTARAQTFANMWSRRNQLVEAVPTMEEHALQIVKTANEEAEAQRRTQELPSSPGPLPRSPVIPPRSPGMPPSSPGVRFKERRPSRMSSSLRSSVSGTRSGSEMVVESIGDMRSIRSGSVTSVGRQLSRQSSRQNDLDKDLHQDPQQPHGQSSSPDILVVDHHDAALPASPISEQKQRKNERERRQQQEMRLAQKENSDFMKELLVQNARRKYRKQQVHPLEDRLSDFYHKIDDFVAHERAEQAAPMSDEQRRRYVLLTRGVKAALAESSDEEEANPFNTV